VQRAGSTSDERSTGGGSAGIFNFCLNVGATAVSAGYGAPHVDSSPPRLSPPAPLPLLPLRGSPPSIEMPALLPKSFWLPEDVEDVHFGRKEREWTGITARINPIASTLPARPIFPLTA
jgi:hypothetical protein